MRDACGRVVVRELGRVLAAQRRDAAREEDDDAVSAGVDDAGLLQRRQQVRAAAHGLLAGDDRALQDVRDATVLLGRVGVGRQPPSCRGRAGSRPTRAMSRATVRIVPSAGWRTDA